MSVHVCFLTCQSGRRLSLACPFPRLWWAPASYTSPHQRSDGMWSTPVFPRTLLQHTHTFRTPHNGWEVAHAHTCSSLISPGLWNSLCAYQNHQSRGLRWWQRLAENLQAIPSLWSSPRLGWWSWSSPCCPIWDKKNMTLVWLTGTLEPNYWTDKLTGFTYDIITKFGPLCYPVFPT